jgi:hypothetical protein
VGVVDAVDEVQTARPAAAGAGHQIATELRFGRCGKGTGLLMAGGDPFDRALVDRLGDTVERISHYAIAALDTDRLKHLDDDVSNLLTHNFLQG